MDLRWSGVEYQKMDMEWTGSTSFSGVVSKKDMKRKHKIEELQDLDEESYVCDNAFHTSPQCPSALRGMRGMCGFSLPGSLIVKARTISTIMKGPPFFYFENVALMPKCEWDIIIRFFNGIEPEFVDSIHFSACHRQRGYVHNLPLEGREVALPKPPMTIEEAFPEKMKFRPSWDTRTKMNCINTVRSSNTKCRMIADTLLKYQNDPPLHEQKILLSKLKKFNLLWVNPGRVAPLEPMEMEILLGFGEEHTRGSSSMTERYKALGNSFQVDTVAYHLSALREMYCDGIKVLSLFSGIGGAEVALHKAGIPLKLVVSVEGNSNRRDVLESWWKRTGQRGRLIHRDNVEVLDHNVLRGLSEKFGGFDLVIGGSPCNNLTGSNRVTRVGLEGEHSRLFFEFPRIYNLVKLFHSTM
ncbi:hypothetical protein L7F22_006276 [Adiantum nelumboides]|nr:hypothetical protein [Adiantum nelumboides]